MSDIFEEGPAWSLAKCILEVETLKKLHNKRPVEAQDPYVAYTCYEVLRFLHNLELTEEILRYLKEFDLADQGALVGLPAAMVKIAELEEQLAHERANKADLLRRYRVRAGIIGHLRRRAK